MNGKRVFAAVMLLLLLAGGLWWCSDPLHGAYAPGRILGRTPEELTERFGPLVHTLYRADGQLSSGEYLLRENRPEWIMSYDDSQWLVVRFADGVAAEVYTRQGQLGG